MMFQIPQQPAYFDWLWQLFYSTDIYGILGPALLAIVGFFLVKKEKAAGIIWFVVESVMMAQYIDLVGDTPFFYWHIVILLLGAIMIWVPLLTSRK